MSDPTTPAPDPRLASYEAARAARAAELCAVGRMAFARGWLPATSGNLSARLAVDRFLVTASGEHKGELTPSSFVVLDDDAVVRDDRRRASAEARLHLSLYRRAPSIGAVLHTHSPAATVLSMAAEPGPESALVFEGFEILKAFEGITTHASRLELPVLPNDQDIERLAAESERHTPGPEHVGYLIAGHGAYTWGRSVADARRHLEALEFLLECELVRRRLSP